MTTLAPDVDTAACDDLTGIRATIDAGLRPTKEQAAKDEREAAVINAALAELQKLGVVAEPAPEPAEVEPTPVKDAA